MMTTEEFTMSSWAYWFRDAMRNKHGGLKAIALALVRPYVKPEGTLPPYLTRCLHCGSKIDPDRTHLCKVPADPCGPSGKAKEDDKCACGKPDCPDCADPVEDAIREQQYPQPASPPKEDRHAYYKRRLRELGMYDDDSDYDGMIGECVEAISELLKGQRHSGGSMYLVMDLLRQLYAEWDGGGIGERPRSEAG